MAVSDNRTGMDALKKRLKYLDRHETRIGMLTGEGKGGTGKGDDAHGGKPALTVAQVYAFHELGLGNNPERSSLGWVMENKKDEIANTCERVQGLVLQGKMDPEKALAFVGEKILSLVKERIRSNIPPPLSEGRKKQKRRAGKSGDVALIHTGQMINSLRYNVLPSID